jgi:hypothetical protein
MNIRERQVRQCLDCSYYLKKIKLKQSAMDEKYISALISNKLDEEPSWEATNYLKSGYSIFRQEDSP